MRSREGQRGSQNPHSVQLSASGEIVGSLDLPGGAIGTPMTYLDDGVQYIALTVGGEVPELIALRLP